jgi:hypothetical protein
MPLLKMADQDLTMLALGTDLTGLGLNLNSSESLHRGFVSPLSGEKKRDGGEGRDDGRESLGVQRGRERAWSMREEWEE